MSRTAVYRAFDVDETSPDAATRPVWLYRLFDPDGALLYVGITFNFKIRRQHHAQMKSWWPLVDHSRTTLEPFPDRTTAAAAERAAMIAERPKWNSHGSPWRIKRQPPRCEPTLYEDDVRAMVGDGELPPSTGLHIYKGGRTRPIWMESTVRAWMANRPDRAGRITRPG